MEENMSCGDDENGGGVARVVVRDEEGGIEGEQEQDEVILKNMISGHPLYGLLVQNHINCLKVGLGEMGEIGEIGSKISATDNANANTNLKAATIPSSSDLDQFMEAYCNVLNKLKEAMEDSVKETTPFILDMYAQLEELISGSKKEN